MEEDEGYLEQAKFPGLNEMTEEERLETAMSLLTSLTFPLMDQARRRLEKILQRDFISLLPRELSAQILGYLNAPTVGRVAAVSQDWQAVAGDSQVWKQLFYNNGWTIADAFLKGHRQPTGSELIGKDPTPSRETFQLTPQRNFRSSDTFARPHERFELEDGIFTGSLPRDLNQEDEAAVLDELSRNNSSFLSLSRNLTLSEADLPHSNPNVNESTIDLDWKYIYRQRDLLRRRWLEGGYIQRELEAHNEAIYCLQFDESRIVSGSRDDTIKVWDMKTLECKYTCQGHDGSVLCLQFDDTYIVSGSSDSSVIVWDLATGRRMRRLRGHFDSVLNLRFDKRLIVTCSKDKTIKVWRFSTGDVISTLVGHRAAINAVQYLGNTVVSASGDRTIKMWSLRTGECIRTLTGHTRGIACLAYDGRTIVSGSSDETIRVWEATSGRCVHVIQAHTDLVRTLQFDRQRIVSGSYDGNICVWDMKTGQRTLLLQGHTSRVFKVQFNESKIVSCSQDLRIIIWDFSQGIDAKYFLS